MNCQRCGFEATTKASLIRHLKRKNTCGSEEGSSVSREQQLQELTHKEYNTRTFDCPYCQRKFNHSSNMYTHKRICKRRDHPVAEADYCEKLKQMEEEMNLLKNQMKEMCKINQNNCNNTTNSTTTTYNIQINAYNKPNLDYLTPTFLTQCVKRRDKGLCELLERIHYHPEHSENHSIRIPNKKLNWIETHNGERFQYQDKNKVLDELIREGFEILEEHYLENEEDIQHAQHHNATRLEEIREFLEACRDQDIHVIAPLKQNVYLLILNKQYILFQKKQVNPAPP